MGAAGPVLIVSKNSSPIGWRCHFSIIWTSIKKTQSAWKTSRVWKAVRLESQLKGSISAHGKTSDKILLPLIRHIWEKALEHPRQLLSDGFVIVKTVLSIGVPAIASIRHDNNQVGWANQTLNIWALEPAIVIPVHTMKQVQNRNVLIIRLVHTSCVRIEDINAPFHLQSLRIILYFHHCHSHFSFVSSWQEKAETRLFLYLCWDFYRTSITTGKIAGRRLVWSKRYLARLSRTAPFSSPQSKLSCAR